MKDILLLKSNRKHLWQRKADVVVVWLFTLLLMLVASRLDANFLNLRNLNNLVSIWLPMALAAYAQTFVILMGGLDLSSGSVISLSSVICATTMTTWGIVPSVAVALLAGAAIGLLNGLLITKGRQQPMIVTLSTQTIFAGVSLLILDKPGGKIDIDFARLVVYGFSKRMPLLILVVASVLLWLVLNRTVYGRSIFAIGGSESSAMSTGIAVDRVKIYTYILSGAVSALSGVLLSAIMSSGDPLAGAQSTMRTITAAVVGGTAFIGGKGGIVGTFAGVFLLAIINNILNLIGMPSYYQYVAQGLILIAALTISAIRTRK